MVSINNGVNNNGVNNNGVNRNDRGVALWLRRAGELGLLSVLCWPYYWHASVNLTLGIRACCLLLCCVSSVARQFVVTVTVTWRSSSTFLRSSFKKFLSSSSASASASSSSSRVFCVVGRAERICISNMYIYCGTHAWCYKMNQNKTIDQQIHSLSD